MRNRRLVVSLGAVALIAAVNALTACTPGNGTPVFETPTPAPTPTPVHCQLVWANHAKGNPASTKVDLFVVDGLERDWVNGPQKDAKGGGGKLTRGYFSSFTMPANFVIDVTKAKAFATSGSFDIALPLGGVIPGNNVVYTATTNAMLVQVTDTRGGLAGAGTFNELWSFSPGPPTIAGPGSDTVSVKVGTSAMVTLGAYGSYAYCFEQP
jgi:hypothetical protein